MASEATTIANGIIGGGWGNTADAYAREIASIQSDLNTPGKITNMQDRLNAQAYVQSLLGSARGAGLDVGSGTNNAASTGGTNGDKPKLGPLEGVFDWLPGGQERTKSMTDELKIGIPGVQDIADSIKGSADWFKNNGGNIGIVVLGVVVIAVALVAASRTAQNTVIQAAKGAVLS